jgi:hypothetical protein
MRCRNCHTQLMDTDYACPSCHASRASATSSAPGEFTKPSGWVNALPALGGAMGGLVAGAIIASSNSSSGGTLHSATGTATRASSPVRVTFGLFFLLGGIVFLGIAGVMFYDTWKIAQWVPKEVTAAELSQTKDPKSYPGPWLAYTFEGSKPTELNVTRPRLNHGGDVEARGLLVQVEDKWMFVSVAPGFEGNRLVGRLSPYDPVQSKPVIEKIRKIEPNPAALLPYEFNAVDGCASDQRQRYTVAGVCGFLGLGGLLPGLLLCRRRRTA